MKAFSTPTLRSRVTRFAFFVSAVLLVFSSAALSGELVDRIVAVVNQDIITLSELNESLAPYIQRIRSMGYSPEQERQMLFKVREEVLNQLIDRKLAEQEIKKSGIRVTDADVDAAIENIKKASFLTDESLRQKLAEEQTSYQDYRDSIRRQIERNRLVNREVKSKIVITKEDVKEFYEQHPERFGGRKKYHLKHILIRTRGEGRTDSEAQSLMGEVLKALSQGRSFEDTAKQYSESPNAAGGGDLGTFEAEQLAPAIRDVVVQLQPGQISKVVDTDLGLQVFFLQEIAAVDGKSLEEATPEIEQSLFEEVVDEKFQEWITELRKQSSIKVIQ